VDATIIHAPSSTKNREQRRDPEMHQTRRGNQWYFRMKAHVGVDSKTAKMTLDTYTQALSPQKRAAQSKVVGMIRPKPSCTVVVPRVSEEILVTH
jgi:hypothetical protein